MCNYAKSISKIIRNAFNFITTDYLTGLWFIIMTTSFLTGLIATDYLTAGFTKTTDYLTGPFFLSNI